MYNVYQHWDKLKVCIVGKSYPPEFYSYITNPRVRNVMERIASETEEDYQKLIKLLESFDVEILRPELKNSIEYYRLENRFIPPPMCPRDISAMVGTTLYWWKQKNYNDYLNIIKKVKNTNKVTSNIFVSAAMVSRIGKDLYFGTRVEGDIIDENYIQERKTEFEKDYRCHFINTGGHTDGCFCPIVPGLIVSLFDIQQYEKTFPDWEVIYLPNQHWNKVLPFIKLKQKNKGKWWVPGEELNDEFTEFVESWLSNWVGYVEETVFDVNMLVIDQKNVVCNNYNKTVFDAFKRYGITPHIINFRHRYFWDGGLHCITSDLDREGKMQDYFLNRGSKSIISL
jgi:N-dimethylarginine dimethylaminohydrolase